MNTENLSEWIQFSRSSWFAAGRPDGLDPDMIQNDPIEFDRRYYDYFERRYLDLWFKIYAQVNPVNGSLIRKEGAIFKDWWNRNFEWATVWKQTLPLLVYGTALGVRNDVIVDLASLYCFGQAVPSVYIDRELDEGSKSKNFHSDVAFCILAYSKTLSRLRAMKIPSRDTMEDTFLSLTGEMYERMLTEHAQRFSPPPIFISESIQNYLNPSSRLLSSVFFGILPMWAHSLANKIIPEQLVTSSIALRMTRQLNDEILDVYDDIKGGMLTLPWLYALEEKPELRDAINSFWTDRTNANFLSSCKKILKESSGQKRASDTSLALLAQSMNLTMSQFHANGAFEITLLHNIRWALINWLEKVSYERTLDTIHFPSSPQGKIVDSTSFDPVEPVPGGGVIVFGATNKVLMSLVMKRGMLRWELPAGTAKAGETLEEAAKREALEETGKQIEIGTALVMCWHFSRELNKGWMGILFQGKLIDENLANNFLVLNPQAFVLNKFNIQSNPELYNTVKVEDYDFEKLLNLCRTNSHPTAHESVIAAGFIDWKKIPTGRIHPLHLKLLQSFQSSNYQFINFLTADADKDIESYDDQTRLYYKN